MMKIKLAELVVKKENPKQQLQMGNPHLTPANASPLSGDGKRVTSTTNNNERKMTYQTTK
jgi:hypothetical protein